MTKKPVAVRPDRAAREAAALRSNLLKRKEQARKRGEAGQAPSCPACGQGDAPDEPGQGHGGQS